MSITASEILSHAAALVKDARQADHGSWDANSITAARIAWALDLDAASAEDWPLLMACLKLARIRETPENPDHYTDAAGYLALAAEQRRAVSAAVHEIRRAVNGAVADEKHAADLAAGRWGDEPKAPSTPLPEPPKPGCFCAHYTDTQCPTCHREATEEAT